MSEVPFVPIKKADVEVRLFGQTDVGHADIIDMGNHIKVNIRFSKEKPEIVQLLAEGLIGLSLEYNSATGYYEHQKRQHEASSEVPSAEV